MDARIYCKTGAGIVITEVNCYRLIEGGRVTDGGMTVKGSPTLMRMTPLPPGRESALAVWLDAWGC